MREEAVHFQAYGVQTQQQRRDPPAPLTAVADFAPFGLAAVAVAAVELLLEPRLTGSEDGADARSAAAPASGAAGAARLCCTAAATAFFFASSSLAAALSAAARLAAFSGCRSRKHLGEEKGVGWGEAKDGAEVEAGDRDTAHASQRRLLGAHALLLLAAEKATACSALLWGCRCARRRHLGGEGGVSWGEVA